MSLSMNSLKRSLDEVLLDDSIDSLSDSLSRMLKRPRKIPEISIPQPIPEELSCDLCDASVLILIFCECGIECCMSCRDSFCEFCDKCKECCEHKECDDCNNSLCMSKGNYLLCTSCESLTCEPCGYDWQFERCFHCSEEEIDYSDFISE